MGTMLIQSGGGDLYSVKGNKDLIYKKIHNLQGMQSMSDLWSCSRLSCRDERSESSVHV